jgi:hypothetical protein
MEFLDGDRSASGPIASMILAGFGAGQVHAQPAEA